MMRYYIILIAIISSFPVYAATYSSIAAKKLAYRVEISGTSDAIKTAVESVSDTIRLADTPPETISLLTNRVQNDKARFQAILHDFGYYAATITSTIDEQHTPIDIHFSITLQQPFRFGSFEIEVIPHNMKIQLPTFTELGLVKGEIARADIVLSAQAKLLQSLNNLGYAFAAVEEPKAVVDHLTQRMNLRYRVTPGKMMVFGTTSLQGLETVKPSFIEQKIPWKVGEPYNPSLITRFDKDLASTNLFSLITIGKEAAAANSNELNIPITLKERLPRTIKAGINYSTDERFGVGFSWEHRNFQHEGESVEITTKIAGITKTGGITYKKPDFYQLNQTLKLESVVSNEITDAYSSNEFTNSIGLERKITDQLTIGIGTLYRFSNVKQLDITDNYGLLGFPLYMLYDTRNNLYDPTKGGNYNLTLTPFLDTLEAHANFLKSYISGTHYFQLEKKHAVVFATRAAFGTINGASTGDIPANERFYAGGGNSVRGYGYKKLSPYVRNTPIGGSSLIELSGELRAKITDKIGIVSFIDGGNSFAEPLPQFNGNLRYGIGMGLRYYTLIAPIRFDAAIPLSKQPGESPFQVYFSLGQAF